MVPARNRAANDCTTGPRQRQLLRKRLLNRIALSCLTAHANGRPERGYRSFAQTVEARRAADGIGHDVVRAADNGRGRYDAPDVQVEIGVGLQREAGEVRRPRQHDIRVRAALNVQYWLWRRGKLGQEHIPHGFRDALRAVLVATAIITASAEVEVLSG